MKLQLSMIISGNDSIARKFLETLTTFPTINEELIRAVGQTLSLAFRLDKEDNANVEYFCMAPIVSDDSTQKTNEIESKYYEETQPESCGVK